MKKRKDGRYFVTRKIDGKSVSVYGKSPAEVYRKLEERMHEAKRPKTFAEIAKAWYDAKWDSFAYGTQNCYRSAYLRALEALGNIPNTEVTPLDVQRILEQMKAQKYSLKAVKTQKTVITTMYKYAILMDNAQTNPASYCEIPSLGKEK